jgi:uncharacterized protein (TIGR02217 family)
MSERITQVNASLISTVPPPNRKLTTISGLLVGQGPVPHRRITGVNATVVAEPPPPHRRFTVINLTVVATRSPNYEFISMIFPDVFPYDISYNSVSGIRFATDVILVDSGDDQRIGRWQQPLMEFDIAYGVRTMEQLQSLIAFFRAMRGRLYAFNYRDNLDYTSSMAVRIEARAAPVPTAFDQTIGTGDGSTYIFQLIKTYTTPLGSVSQVRPINRVEPDTTVVAVNGSHVTNWTIDTNAGLLTFVPQAAVTISAHTIQKSALGGGGTGQVLYTGQAGDFTAFKPYVGQRMTTYGWANSDNNVPLGSSLNITLTAVASDGSTLTIAFPGGNGAEAETLTNVSFATHPAPPATAVISAGYQFFVPCRFDTDVLPTTLEDYGIGSANSVKLVEVRPTAF